MLRPINEAKAPAAERSGGSLLKPHTNICSLSGVINVDSLQDVDEFRMILVNSTSNEQFP